jgi:DNA-binding transcriptional MerR regulator
MDRLQQLSQQAPSWSLEALVQVANELLPQFLPEDKAHTRVREEVTPRLVRHYTTQGLLDEPLKVGREARYSYRHLLQVLLVRRLLTEGYGASVIDTLARSKTNADLEALLQGSIQLTVAPANPALSFLQQVQNRAADTPQPPTQSTARSVARSTAHPPAHPPVSPPQSALLPSAPSSDQASDPTASISTTEWIRQEILPGLEIHMRSDFVMPATAQEQQNLLQRIIQSLTVLVSSNGCLLKGDRLGYDT